MNNAIVTHYLPPTDFKGARARATIPAEGTALTRISTSWNYALSAYENHLIAAKALAAKLGYTCRFHKANLRNGYVFIPYALTLTKEASEARASAIGYPKET